MVWLVAVMYSSRLSSQKDNGDRRTLDELTILATLGLVALGFFASGYGVLIGSGGGFIVAPLLIILFGMDHNLAVGTSLFTVALASISGSVSYLYLKRVDLRSALLFSMAAIPGSLLGILGLKAVTEGPFEVIFGSFLSLLGLYVMFRPEYKPKPSTSGGSPRHPHAAPGSRLWLQNPANKDIRSGHVPVYVQRARGGSH